MLFWGLSFVWFKIVVLQYSPITIIFLRLIISGSLLILFLLATRSFQRLHRRHLHYFLLLAFTQPFCYFLGESFGLTYVSSTIASVIIATIPLFSPIAAYYFVKERISRQIIYGLLFSFAGILFMIVGPNLTLNASPTGVLLLFVAVFSAVAYSVIIRKIAPHYSPVTIITYQNLIGALYFLPLFMIFDFGTFITIKPDIEVWTALLQLAFFASSLAYVFYIISIRELGMVKSNIFTNLIPVFTGIASYFVLGERFSVLKILGIMMVLGGVVISQGDGIRMLIKKSRWQRSKIESK